MTKYSLIIIIVGMFLLASPALALDPLVPACGRSGAEPCTTCDILTLGKNISDFVLFYLVPALSALFFVYAGFEILLGGGIPARVAKGQNIFKTTVLGLIVIFLAWLIVNTVLRTVAGDQNIAENWWKLECRENVTTIVSSAPTPTGTCFGVSCSDSSLNICGSNTSANCSETAVNRWNDQIRAAALTNQIGSGINTEALIKAIMSQESGGRTNITASDGLSYGIMQLKPETADQFKSGCTSANITSAWLNNSNNVQASVCIAINYLKSLVGSCGISIRNLAAGYNGGGATKGACDFSQSCASCSMCGNEKTRRWECLWDGPDGEHQVCNVDRAGSSFNATRKYAPKVSYCYGRFGETP